MYSVCGTRNKYTVSVQHSNVFFEIPGKIEYFHMYMVYRHMLYLQLRSACVSSDGGNCKLFVACQFYGFFTSMYFHMFIEIANLCKLFFAHITHIWFLAGVN